MATAVDRPTVLEPARLSWGALFGGAFVTFGLWALFAALGVALGLSGINPNDPSTLKGAGMFSGIWGLVSPLVALFFGAWVSARTSGVLDRTSGVIHGAVLWGFTTVVGAWLALSLITAVVGTAVNAAGSVAQGAGQAASGMMQGQVAQQAGQAAQGLQRQVQQSGPQIAQGAASAAQKSSVGFWGLFVMLAIGLISSILGALTGASLLHRHAASAGRARVVVHEPQEVRP